MPYPTVTIDDTTHEFRTSREAKNYLFSLLEQHPSPSHFRQIKSQLEDALCGQLQEENDQLKAAAELYQRMFYKYLEEVIALKDKLQAIQAIITQPQEKE